MGPFGALCISLWKTGTPVLYLVVWGRGPTSPRGGTARPRRRFPVAKAVHSTLGFASRQCVALRWPWRRGPGSLSPAPPVSAGCPPAGTRAVSPGMPDSPALTFAKCSVLQSWPRPTIAKQTLLRSLRGLPLLPFSCFASRSAGGAGGATKTKHKTGRRFCPWFSAWL